MTLRCSLELTPSNELEVKIETGEFSGVFVPLNPPVVFPLSDWAVAERFVEAHARRVKDGTVTVAMFWPA